VNEALKPYLARSAGLHVAAAAAFLILAHRAGPRADRVYMIDFVGGGPTLTSAGPSAAAAKAAPAARPAPAKVPRQADRDAIRTHGRRGPAPLPRPSLLGGGADLPAPSIAPAPEASLAGAPGAGPEQKAAGPAGPAGAGVSTDLPNFPYPWYISRVRLSLWQAWQTRMPRLDADGGVSFSILRNGSITDLEIESSSGDPSFDRAALESVQAAAPFPPLPADFHEQFLKIHLTLKSEEAWR
jgi:protein TonB